MAEHKTYSVYGRLIVVDYDGLHDDARAMTMSVFEDETRETPSMGDMLISPLEAHKLADWIKENIPEPPPAPPEWRIDTTDGEAILMIGLVSMGVIGSDGIVRDYGISEYDGVTPELHKEMICALLDAHYELHKGES